MEGYRKHGELYGGMRHRVEFKRIVGSNNSGLSSGPTETSVRTCYASVGRASMKEGVEGGRETSTLTRIFTVRYHSDIDDDSLILVHNDEEYDIEGIEDLHGDNAFFQIRAVRRR